MPISHLVRISIFPQTVWVAVNDVRQKNVTWKQCLPSGPMQADLQRKYQTLDQCTLCNCWGIPPMTSVLPSQMGNNAEHWCFSLIIQRWFEITYILCDVTIMMYNEKLFACVPNGITQRGRLADGCRHDNTPVDNDMQTLHSANITLNPRTTPWPLAGNEAHHKQWAIECNCQNDSSTIVFIGYIIVPALEIYHIKINAHMCRSRKPPSICALQIAVCNIYFTGVNQRCCGTVTEWPR